jgi:ABC-2 type transport system ATP-binding protein
MTDALSVISPERTATVEVQGLTKRFGSVRAVDHVDFRVLPGSICGFIGPNGAGKTTTMRILATLDLPDSGDALIDGLSILRDPMQVRRRVGFMPDRFEPLPNLTVLQYLDFFARAYGLRGRERVQTVGAVSEFCGLTTFATRPATGLSKGMGQRLHLAKTILHQPAFLILDEPAAGLDPRARIEFRGLIRALAAEGMAILISSHILAELSETCDYVVVIENGKIVVGGSIQDVSRGVQLERRVIVRPLGDVEPLQRFALTQPHVRDVRAVEGRVEFVFDGEDEDLADLLARAIGGGLRVLEFSQRGAGLEDIFLHATKGVNS